MVKGHSDSLVYIYMEQYNYEKMNPALVKRPEFFLIL